MNFFTEHNKGLIGTVIIHAVILMLMILFGFIAPFPPPEEKGILVNFGDSENGLGLEEPAPVAQKEEPVQAEETEEVPAVAPPKPVMKEKPKPVKEQVVTQDYEKTAALEAAKRKKKEEDRLKQLEIEKQRKEEIERQRLEAEAKKKKEEENRKVAEIENRTKGAFGNPSGTGGTGSGTGQNQGVTYPSGNQGAPTGDPNAGTYGPGSGTGTKGTGISYSLAGRTATSTPKPTYPGKDDGTVVVKITVDKSGRVTSAEPGQRGTTTMNPDLHDAARRAALQAKFNVDDNAPAFQTGTITYRFIIQSQ
jgi:colicin import membrane protein